MQKNFENFTTSKDRGKGPKTVIVYKCGYCDKIVRKNSRLNHRTCCKLCRNIRRKILKIENKYAKKNIII